MLQNKPKVLMIEGDRFLRKIYRNKLLQSGFEFLEATNGEEGLNKIFSEKPDLVILDIILPIKNGFDVLFEVKRNRSTRPIPIIIVSNLGQEADIQRGLSLGAEEYLVKADVTLSQVVKKVKEVIMRTKNETY